MDNGKIEEPIKVAIIGARSYTARELIGVLARHPLAEIVSLQARVDEPTPISETFGQFRQYGLPPITPISVEALPDDLDVAFLCLPHTVSAEFAIELYQRGIKVIDLSADFRYSNHREYERVYGVDHPAPDLNRKAIYGLAEINRVQLISAPIIACPGCYPTSVLLGLAPVVRREMIDPKSIISDSKSGLSGAGRTPTDGSHYCSVNENFKAYKVASHRHQSEIEEHLTRLAGESCNVTFVPHLVPMDRGILSTIYANLLEPMTLDALQSLYHHFYSDKPFVRLLTGDELPCTKDVSGTNYCDIAIRVDERNNRLIIISAIDNLLKGASGQAVQCMNISYGLPETLGFTTDAIVNKAVQSPQ